MPVNNPTVTVSNINNEIELRVEYNDSDGYRDFSFVLSQEDATKLVEDIAQEVEDLQ